MSLDKHEHVDALHVASWQASQKWWCIGDVEKNGLCVALGVVVYEPDVYMQNTGGDHDRVPLFCV